MTFYEFLDVKFRNNSIDRNQNYTLFKDGITNAIQSMLTHYRTISKWLAYGLIVVEFFAVKLKLRDAPQLIPMPEPAAKKLAAVPATNSPVSV